MTFPMKASLLMVAFALAGPTAAQDNPIVAEVKLAVSDASKPFAMALLVKVKDGQGAKFEAAFVKAQKATRQEKGCQTYELNRHAKDESRYVVYERWRNVDALASHMNTEHIRTLLAEIHDLLEGAPEVHVFTPIGE